MSNGSWLDAFKTILSSPVGGWVMACLITATMAWVISRDRQVLYEELRELREEALPSIQENNEMLKEIRQILKEQQR